MFPGNFIRIMSFYVADNCIWIRNYQIVHPKDKKVRAHQRYTLFLFKLLMLLPSCMSRTPAGHRLWKLALVLYSKSFVFLKAVLGVLPFFR